MCGFQELRENEKACELLNGEYPDANSRRKAIGEFKELESKYPVRLLDDKFDVNRLNWDFDMDFYLVDIEAEKLV
jgi:hypothetical protein